MPHVSIGCESFPQLHVDDVEGGVLGHTKLPLHERRVEVLADPLRLLVANPAIGARLANVVRIQLLLEYEVDALLSAVVQHVVAHVCVVVHVFASLQQAFALGHMGLNDRTGGLVVDGVVADASGGVEAGPLQLLR